MLEGTQRWMLSGPIGSGKSEVRRLLDEMGFATIDSDTLGHQVIAPGGPAFEAVAERFPEALADGTVDRSALGSIVFSDERQLKALEDITHPHIFGLIDIQVSESTGVTFVEFPLLHKTLGDDWGRIVVDADEETRLARVIERGLSRDEAIKRLNTQPSRAQWLAAADVVVPNHGTREELRQTVENITGYLRGHQPQ